MKTPLIMASKKLQIYSHFRLSLFIGLIASLTSQAQILSDGDGTFQDGTTWQGGVAPTSTDSWTIQSGNAVTASGNLAIQSPAVGQVDGSLDMDGNNITLSGGGTLNLNGNLTLHRLLNSSSGSDEGGIVNVNSGTLTFTSRIYLTQSDFDNTLITQFNLNGGSVSGSGENFRLYGADSDDTAQLSVTGSAGSFIVGNTDLFNSATGFENSATDLNFTFGSSGGSGALTVLNTGNLTLGGNEVTIDFSSIDRGSHSGSLSTTLIDYGNNLTGSLGTLNSVGLAAGESASLFHDAIDGSFRVDYTLVAIPEPSTYGLMADLLGLYIVWGRRRR
ncbi:MAG: hypothetical protein HRU10_13820 [Opitutales bacterium]|nr:hypothetical protein [Opitutales bacterium]